VTPRHAPDRKTTEKATSEFCSCCLNNYVPMDSKIKSIVNVVVVIVVVWLLQAFGVLNSLQNIRIR
jgi:hypothetical protein